MATIITHAITAGALSTIAPRDLPRIRLALVLAILSIIPDLDVIGFYYGIPYGHPLGHRGFAHSALFAATVALFIPSIAFNGIVMNSRKWWVLVGFSFIATMSHGVMDAFTDAGLGVGFFIPFDDTRYFAPWRPLRTSPLSVSAFIDGPAIRILINEIIWVGLPLMAFFGVWHVIRRTVGPGA